MNRRHFLYPAVLALCALPVLLRAEPKVLYEQASTFGQVIVTEENGMRTLQFEKGGALQTVVKLGDPGHLELAYASVAFTGLALCREPARVLVVGLGGGTLPMFVHAHYPKATIDAVEIDPQVVHVARKFFGFQDDDRMRAHVGDGRAFIEKCRQPYDVIFLDAFGSDSVPPSLTTEEFLRAVRRALTPHGVVVGNIWSREFNTLYDAMVRTYQEVFDEVSVLDVRAAGNKIVLAVPRRRNLGREEFAGLARAVARERRFRFDLGERVEFGFQGPVARNPDSRVLRDAEMGVTK